MTIHFFPTAGREPLPWLNGGGITREIAKDTTSGKPRWRLSHAEISTQGPFSGYPGYRRFLILLTGAGIRLRVDGITYEIGERFEVSAFDGAAEAVCTLIDGPVTVFNVFLARDSRSPSVDIHRLQETFPISDAGLTAMVCLDGALSIAETNLSTLDAVILDGSPVLVTPRPSAVFAKIRL
jgi:environmental stress-induced protein Ves